jgi:uncharacterized protein
LGGTRNDYKRRRFLQCFDADSEGVEGKFYCWSEKELKQFLKEDFEWVKDYYNINQLGYWEEGQYILLRKEHQVDFCKRTKITPEKIAEVNQLLFDERKTRVRPGLDYKCLTSWNAMMIKGYIDAYLALEEEQYLHAAIKNAKWIQQFQLQDNLHLYHNYVDGKPSIDGFLEDYAHVIAAFIRLYEATFEEEYLILAKNLTDKTIIDFQDENSNMFYFTNKNNSLIARKMDNNDNVIPASNSVMCHNLFLLGHFFANEEYIKVAQQMLMNVYHGMENYGSGYSNWALTLMNFTHGFKEIAITGPSSKANTNKLQAYYLPNVLFLWRH